MSSYIIWFRFMTNNYINLKEQCVKCPLTDNRVCNEPCCLLRLEGEKHGSEGKGFCFSFCRKRDQGDPLTM